MLRATFFDLDGTLADTEPLHFTALAETLATVGISLGEADYFRRYLSLTDEATFARAIEDFDRADLRPRVDALVADKTSRFAMRLASGVPLLPGAASFVAEAAARGPVALVTGARRHEALAVLGMEALRDRFAVIVTADDVSRGKPDPEPYRRAFGELRSPAGASSPLTASRSRTRRSAFAPPAARASARSPSRRPARRRISPRPTSSRRRWPRPTGGGSRPCSTRFLESAEFGAD
ncbi:MAG: HAD family hydrolase, partial [Candidatus Binatia bacterium]